MAPVTILVVDKSGNIKESQLKSYVETDLYKKAGFKTTEGFKCQTQWNIDNLHGKSFYISVFGKTDGRANQENKYDFPPPIDSTLMFGSCIIVNKTITGEAVSVSEDEWETIYDHLFGGFEDLGDKDSDEDDDDEDDDDDLPRTKEGYVKDDFVVDDDDEDYEDDEDDEEEEEDEDEEEEEDFKPKAKRSKAKPAPKPVTRSRKSKDPDNIFTKISENQENYLDCTSELKEEEYV
jgi:hypothetical protein